jgi:hypothetical protein
LELRVCMLLSNCASAYCSFHKVEDPRKGVSAGEMAAACSRGSSQTASS